MRLYFVHGWAFGPDCFDALAEKLADYPQVRADLGYFGDKNIPQFANGDVLIGHSLGFAWGFSQRADWAKTIAINSFPRFQRDANGRGCVAPAELRALRKFVLGHPRLAASEFRARHGGASCRVPNGQALRDGLDLLESWDINHFAARDAQKLVLASADDPLVPLDAGRELAQTQNATQDAFVLRETGGHGLPWTAPEFCAENIRDFLRHNGG